MNNRRKIFLSVKMLGTNANRILTFNDWMDTGVLFHFFEPIFFLPKMTVILDNRILKTA